MVSLSPADFALLENNSFTVQTELKHSRQIGYLTIYGTIQGLVNFCVHDQSSEYCNLLPLHAPVTFASWRTYGKYILELYLVAMKLRYICVQIPFSQA
jgi:hypothetical protein